MDPNSAAQSSGSFANPSNSARALTAAFVLFAAAARFAHLDLLWVEEAYPMAAAAEVLRGKPLTATSGSTSLRYMHWCIRWRELLRDGPCVSLERALYVSVVGSPGTAFGGRLMNGPAS